MNQIKHTYWPIDKHCSVGETNLEECAGLPLDPNGFTMLFCVEGKALINLNFKRTALHRGSLLVVPFDMTFILIRKSRNLRLLYFSVTMEMADDALHSITAPLFWDFLYEHPCSDCTEAQQQMLVHWFSLSQWTFNHYGCRQGYSLLINHLYNFFMSLYYEIKRKYGSSMEMKEINRANTLLSQFDMFVNRYCSRCREVAFYADKLNITPDYLHKLVDTAYGTSPKKMIDKQVVLAIKTYLATTDLSIKNIATELHFEDASYMCRFFRKRVGLSPLQYRSITETDDSDFA